MYDSTTKWFVLFLFVACVGLSFACSGDEDVEFNGDDAGVDADVDGGGDGVDRPSGEVEEVFSGEPLQVDDARREQAREDYEQLDKDELDEMPPDELYDVYNEFVLTHFGPANQPLITEYTGEVLDFRVDADWVHASRNSATIAFETTLPAIGYVEYSKQAQDLSESSDESERYYFNQIHHLRDLDPDTTYYYRLVARGDDGETIASTTRSFETESEPEITEIPGDLSGPPYRLTEDDTTYLVTEDIGADATALIVEASGVTIDLNGHTVVYADDPDSSADPGDGQEAHSGIWASSSDVSDVTIVNGRLEEGQPGNESSSDGGFNPIYLSSVTDINIAGVSMDYQAAQLHALLLRYPSGEVRLRHNRFTDRGYEILDRHGSGGGRPLRIIADDPQPGEVDDFEVDHNLVTRTRQNGLMRAPVMRDNEVYVDSWATNSFAIQPFSRDDQKAGEIRRNKLFLTGYNAIGFGWAHLDLLIEDNLVQMEAVATDDRRYTESWGEQDTTSAFRITNYGDGGQVRDNLVYRDNVVLGRARGEGVVRGSMFYTDTNIEETLFEGNFVHITAEDDESLDATPVVGQGVFDNREDHQPAYYVDNVLASNVANVRFGDDYGRGDRHTFIDTTFRRVGDHPDYHTIVFDGGFHSTRHELIDPVFEGGASYDDVWWRRTSNLSYYTVSWSLTVQGEPGESVTITDVDDEQVFSGELDDEGQLEESLQAVTIRPEEWEEGGDQFEVQQRRSHQEIVHTPHEVTVGSESKSVEMESPQTVEFGQ